MTTVTKKYCAKVTSGALFLKEICNKAPAGSKVNTKSNFN
jgi:hypothetical protein